MKLDGKGKRRVSGGDGLAFYKKMPVADVPLLESIANDNTMQTIDDEGVII